MLSMGGCPPKCGTPAKQVTEDLVLIAQVLSYAHWLCHLHHNPKPGPDLELKPKPKPCPEPKPIPCTDPSPFHQLVFIAFRSKMPLILNSILCT